MSLNASPAVSIKVGDLLKWLWDTISMGQMGTAPKSTVGTGEMAPPFVLRDLNAQNRSLHNALAEGPLLLAFFKVGCPTCQFAFPFLERLNRLFARPRPVIWGISQDDASASRDFAAHLGLRFPILIDPKPYKVSNDYGVSYTPTIFLVGRSGKVQLAGDGFSKQDLLDAQKGFSRELEAAPGDLFLPGERIPEFKPG